MPLHRKDKALHHYLRLYILLLIKCLSVVLLGAALLSCRIVLPRTLQVAPQLPETPTVPPSLRPSAQDVEQPTKAETPSKQVTPINPLAPVTLTLWLPSEMVPISEAAKVDEAQAVIAQVNQQFLEENPRVYLNPIPKELEGPAGMPRAILATAAVAPHRLPDLAVINAADLADLVGANLVTPVDDLMPSSYWNDLYAVALDAVTVDGQQVGIPLQADILLLAHNTSALETAPRTWDELIQSRTEYAFPINNERTPRECISGFIVSYVSYGGALAADGFGLNIEPAAAVLSDYIHAREHGVITERVRALATMEECWALLRDGKVALAQVSSSSIQREGNALKTLGYSSLPTASAEPSTVASVLAWVVLTQDAQRRELAARYIATLLDDEHLPLWLQSSYHLPLRRSLLSDVVGENAELEAFLDAQMRHAFPYPAAPHRAEWEAALLRAIQDTLDGLSTPERAALAAATNIARLR